MARIVIVNENDEIIGHKERGTLDKEEIYRVSALWITNSKGEILLAQRSFSKKHHPGYWGPAVAGTIDEGEDYEDNIIKEAKEEIGLTDISPIKLIKKKVTGEFNHFTQWFGLKMDKDISEFEIQKEEVEALKWISFEDLKKDFLDNPDSYYISTINDILENPDFFNQ